MKTLKRITKKLIFILLPFVLIAAVLEAGVFISHTSPRFIPSTKTDISDILKQETFSAEDYKTLFEQTGLTQISVDALVADNKKDDLLKFQKNYFSEPEFIPEQFSPFTCCHVTVKEIPTAPLQKGDIIITPTTHFSFFNVGHAALVVDTEENLIINATGYDYKSSIDPVSTVTQRPAFIILRPKIEAQKRLEAVDYALNNLKDLQYSVSLGIIGNKFEETPTRTNCGHIVWYAYNKVGLDIDSNGGRLVLPRDIIQSEHFEIVQVYGMDAKDLPSYPY